VAAVLASSGLNAITGPRVQRVFEFSFAPEHLFFRVLFRCHRYVFAIKPDGDNGDGGGDGGSGGGGSGASKHFLFRNAALMYSNGCVGVVQFDEKSRTLTVTTRGGGTAGDCAALVLLHEISGIVLSVMSEQAYRGIGIVDIQVRLFLVSSFLFFLFLFFSFSLFLFFSFDRILLLHTFYSSTLPITLD
jgi:hypothetical protein